MVKKSIKKIKQTESSKAVVVQPIQLPVATDTIKVKIAWTSIILTSIMIVLNIFIWGFLFFKGVEVYNTYYVRRPMPVKVKPQPKHKQNVVAVIGNEEISLDEVKAFVAEVPQLAEIPFEQVYPTILDMMINDKVIANGAKKAGVPNDPQIKKMIKMAENQIVAQAYLTSQIEKALTEADIRAAYDEEVKNFKPEEEIHARHILVLTEKQAQDILIQLKAGADFGLLADQKSIDKNAPQGDLGYFTREMMIPEFAEAVFAMKKGELSGPVKTAFGWHIIQVDDRRPTQAPAFEQVKEQMQRIAVEKKIPEIVAAERMRQNVKVVRPTLVSQPVPPVQPQPVQSVTE